MADNNKYSLEEELKRIGKEITDMTESMMNDARQQVKALAAQTHALVVERVNEKVTNKSKRDIYLESLSLKDISGGQEEIWSVSLSKDAAWIEDGKEAGERIDEILNNGKPAKTNKDGKKYKIIPFNHKKSAATSSTNVKMANFVKTELKKRGLDKVVSDQQGKPIIGKVASVDLVTNNKKGAAFVSKFNRPLLQGLSVYQREVKSPDGKSSVKRDVLTFRVISESQKNSGLWQWKEQEGVHIFEEVEKKVETIWTQMVKDIVDSYK